MLVSIHYSIKSVYIKIVLYHANRNQILAENLSTGQIIHKILIAKLNYFLQGRLANRNDFHPQKF